MPDTAEPAAISQPHTHTGRWPRGVSGFPSGPERRPAWKRIAPIQRAYASGLLGVQPDRLADLTTRLKAALEARQREIASSAAPRHVEERHRIAALLHQLWLEEFA